MHAEAEAAQVLLDKRRLLSQTYGISLANVSQRIKNYVNAENWTIVLGNNIQKTQKQASVFQNLRLWSIDLSPSDSFDYLFVQPPIKDGLLVSLPLQSGEINKIKNRASIDSKDWIHQTAKVSHGQFYVQDPERPELDRRMLICGPDRYFNHNTGLCQTMPYDNAFMPLTKVTEFSGHFATVSPQYQRPSLTLPDSMLHPVYRYVWTTSTDSFQQALQLQAYEPSLGLVASETPIQLKHMLSNLNGHNYYMVYEQEELLFDCVSLYDKLTETNVVKIDEFVNEDDQIAQDLCFKFAVNDSRGPQCDRNYDINLLEKIGITTSPPLPIEFMDSVSKEFTGALNFEYCYPASVISDPTLFPRNEQVNFIFTTYWTAQQVSQTHLDLVYQVTVIEPIYVQVRASLTEVGLNDNLQFTTDGTQMQGYKGGLIYTWICPPVFKDWCDSYYSSPIMDVPYTAFLNFGADCNKEHEFGLKVRNVLSDSTNPAVWSSMMVNVTWVELPQPRFDIKLYSPTHGADLGAGSQIFYNELNEIKVHLYNYRLTNHNIRFDWSIAPEQLLNKQNIQYSKDESQVLLLEGALKPETTYTVSVRVFDLQNPSISTAMSLQFGTLPSLTTGSLEVSPTSGIALSTSFVVNMSGWRPASGDSSDLHATFWAVAVHPDYETKTQISERLPFTQVGDSYTLQIRQTMPLTERLDIQVTDALGNSEWVHQPIQVQFTDENALADPQSVLQSCEDANRSQMLAAVIAFINKSAQEINMQESQLTKEGLQTDTIPAFLTALQEDIDSISNDLSPASVFKIQGAAEALKSYSEEKLWLTTTSVDQIQSMLDQIKTYSVVYEDLVKNDAAFGSNIAQTVAQVMDWSSQTSKAAFIEYDRLGLNSLRGRRLQEDKDILQQIYDSKLVNERALSFMNSLTTDMCKANQHTQSFKRINARNLELITQGFTTSYLQVPSDIQFTYSGDGSTVFVPIDEVRRQTMDLEHQANYYCVRAAFSDIQIDGHFSFKASEQVLSLWSNVQVWDDQQFALTDSNNDGMQYLTTRPFGQVFNYDYSPNTFINNITVCMGIDMMQPQSEFMTAETLEQRIFSNTQKWTSEGCQTFYEDSLVGNPQIRCLCDSINQRIYTIVNDFTRIPITEEVEESNYIYSLHLLIVPLLIYIVLMPMYVLHLDHRDYNRIQDDKFYISDDFVDKFAQKMQLDSISEAHYKLIDIEYYKRLGPIFPGSFAALAITNSKFHPLFGIFSSFDYRLKRLTRLALLTIQLNIILLGAMGLIFKLGDESSMVSPQRGELFLFVVICAILTLPLPDFIYRRFRAKIKRIENYSVIGKQLTEQDNSFNSQNVYLEDNCLYEKCGLISTAFCVHCFSICLLFCFYMKGYVVGSFFQVSRLQCQGLVMTFWTSTVMFGFFILNTCIRPGLISFWAVQEAQTILQRRQQKSKQDAFKDLEEGDSDVEAPPVVEESVMEKCDSCWKMVFCCLKGSDYGFRSSLFIPFESTKVMMEAIVVQELYKQEKAKYKDGINLDYKFDRDIEIGSLETQKALKSNQKITSDTKLDFKRSFDKNIKSGQNFGLQFQRSDVGKENVQEPEMTKPNGQKNPAPRSEVYKQNVSNPELTPEPPMRAEVNQLAQNQNSLYQKPVEEGKQKVRRRKRKLKQSKKKDKHHKPDQDK